MNGHSGRTTSVWMKTGEIPVQPKLSENIKTDVCVVGAGIAGMSTAFLLASEGKEVVVLDDGPIAGGETERTTAHLVSALDDRYFSLERFHGEKGSRLAAQSHTEAITQIERIVAAENIDCEFDRVDGYLFVPPGDSTEILEKELAAVHRAGLTDVKRLNQVPWTFFNTGPCLQFPKQGQFHPLKYDPRHDCRNSSHRFNSWPRK